MRASVGTCFASCVAACLLAWGCASPKPADSGAAGSSPTGSAGNSSSGSAGTTGAGTAGNSSSGSAGSSSSGSAGTTGGPVCTVDINNLVTPGAWICAKDTPIMVQGAFYGYTDGMSCTPDTNICDGTGDLAGCCV